MSFETWKAYFFRLEEYGPMATRMTREVMSKRTINILSNESLPLEMLSDGQPFVRTGYDTNKRTVFFDSPVILAGMTPDQIEARHVARLLTWREL